ncbi:MAG: class I SAM-dependent methyltransferase [Terrisporobacter sp.]|uniref:class I SAM-dependent methyltransferase n=1 Tax=Terrisporobacter sp. TaxID=1965305 RepID=UPI002FCA6F5E
MINKRDVFSLGGLHLVSEIIDMYKLNENIKVLDVGCGSGYSVNYLTEKGFDVTGIDFSEDAIKKAKETYGDINIKVMDSHNMEFDNDFFDLILLECSLSIMKDPKLILTNCKDLLKKDGLILLSDFFFKKTSIRDDTYTLNYWNKLFGDLDYQVINFQDKSREWRNYLGMVLWEYGELSGLLRGCENNNLNQDILNKESGYFLVVLRKRE